RLRRLVSGSFSPRRVEALRARVQAIIDELLDRIAAQGPHHRVDLVAGYAFPLPFTVICELLGVPEPDRAALGAGLAAMLGPTSTPAQYAQAKTASDAVVAMLDELVHTKQHQPGDDLISALIAARDGEERLDNQELLSTIFQLIVAGHDTTTSLIGNSIVALLQNPDQLTRPGADPPKPAAAVEQLLPYDAPVPHPPPRSATEAVPLAEVTTPAGAQVLLSLAAANRDPHRYPHPELLDINRTENRHLA